MVFLVTMSCHLSWPTNKYQCHHLTGYPITQTKQCVFNQFLIIAIIQVVRREPCAPCTSTGSTLGKMLCSLGFIFTTFKVRINALQHPGLFHGSKELVYVNKCLNRKVLCECLCSSKKIPNIYSLLLNENKKKLD